MADSNPQELQTSGAKFDIGAMVEVCPKDRDAWFPATLLKQVNDNQFVVEYESERTQDLVGKVIETVDSFHIRPCPPDISHDKSFNLLEKVEAFYDCGWWSGVVNRVLAGSKYVVFFKQQNEQKEFTRSELRCRMDWIGGKWVKDSKDIPATAHKRGQTKSSEQTRSLTAGKKVQSTCKSEFLPPRKKLKAIEALKTTPSLKHCHVRKMPTKDEATAVQELNIVHLPKRRRSKLNTRTARQETGPLVSNTETSVRGEEQNPDRGKSQVPGDMIETLAKGPEQATPSKEKTGCDVQGKEVVQEVHVDGASRNNPCLPQPLPMWMGESILPPITYGEGVGWPFKKESPTWEIVESLKCFQVMLQKPHFRPLEQYHMDFREGEAIGCMLTFSYLVERICDLKGDEPRSDLLNMLEALPRLEALGFNVEPIEALLKDMLTIKDKQEQLNREITASREHSNIQQLNKEKLKSDEDEMGNTIDEMENTIKDLQQSLDDLKKEMESTAIFGKQVEVSIYELRRSMGTIKGQIDESRRDIHNIKSARWGTSLQLE